MGHELRICYVPTVICVVITGIWLLAGQGFFADKMVVKRADTLDEAVANMRMQYGMLEAAGKTRFWMAENLVAWPSSESSFTGPTAIRMAAHPFLHTGIFGSIATIVVLFIAGAVVENRNGSVHTMLLILGAIAANAAILYLKQPDGPIYGSWPIIAAMLGSMVCASNGFVDPKTGLFIRITGIAGLAALFLHWPDQIFGGYIDTIQWLPGAALGAVLGAMTWVMGD